MECSNRRGEAELIGTFHFSPHENILTIAEMKTFIVLYVNSQLNCDKLTGCYIIYK